jgi:hypothetical protein
VNDFTIIGLVGGGRTGKNTIAERLEVQHGFWELAFAEPLYDGLQATLNLPDEVLDPDRKDSAVPELGVSLRELLQGYGDFIRAKCGPDILIRRLHERLRKAAGFGHDAFVITDVRLEAEIAWIRSMGGAIWWVARPNSPAIREHHTEAIIEFSNRVSQPADVFLLNDGTWAELAVKVDVQVEALLTGEFSR